MKRTNPVYLSQSQVYGAVGGSKRTKNTYKKGFGSNPLLARQMGKTYGKGHAKAKKDKVQL